MCFYVPGANYCNKSLSANTRDNSSVVDKLSCVSLVYIDTYEAIYPVPI